MISWALAWSAVQLGETEMLIFILFTGFLDLFIVGALVEGFGEY